MAEISKQALKVDNNQSFPNNNNGAITPSILRAFNVNMIDSMVDEIGYNQDSASWNVSIDNIEAFTASLQTAFVSTASFNAFTQSINQYTASNNTKWNNAEAATASLFTSVANLNQFTASQVGAFTELNLFSASAKISIAALNQASSSLQSFTQSANVSITNLNTTTASLNTSVSNINTFTASAGVSITNLNQSSASQQVSIDSLNSKTGSYATTGSNTFTGANTFTSISASSFISASEFVGNGSKITGITASISLPILDEGIPQGNAFSMNFTGSGISAVVVGGTAVVSVNTPDSGTINNLTASFNAYTASTNLDLAAIHQATASLQLFTSSFSTSSLVSTSSFNAYTASNDQRVTSLEANSASVNTSITNINTATASLFTSASLALVTASVNNDDITFTKGDGTQFTIQVATGSFALSASYAETSSITRNVVVIARNGNASTLDAGTVVHITSGVGDNPIFTTASYDNEALSSNTFGLLRYSSPSGADVEVVVNGVVLGVNTDPALGYAAGDVLYLSSSGQFTKVQPQAPNQIVTIGQVLRAQQNNGSIYVDINNGWELNELHNVQINNAQTGDLLQYESSSYGLWKNKSIEGAGITTTSSFNSYTSSNDAKVNSLISATGSYATTGSNNFNGNQVITGSVTISGSAQTDLTVIGQIYVSSSATGATTAPQIIVSGSQGTTTIRRNQITTRNLTYQNTFSPILVDNSNLTTADAIGMTIDTAAGGVAGWGLGPAIYVNNVVGDTYPAVFGFQNKANYTDGRVAVLTPLSASAGFTASLQNGYAWVGNSLGQNTQVATSSFGTAIDTASFATTASFNSYTQSTNVRLNNIEATTASLNTSVSNLNTATASLFTSASLTLTTASVNLNTITFTKGDGTTFALTVNTGSGGGGGASFPYSGSVEITGSVKVKPFTLTVSANTASINMNESNYFILNLPTSSTTHVAFTNIIPGESINLLVSQSATAATGSIAFAPNIYFPNGSDYQATSTGSARDIVSFITFNANEIYATQIKNLY